MTEENPQMLGKTEMAGLDISPAVAGRAVEQTRQRAEYLIELRHKIEVRAAALLRAFLGLAIAIVGFGVGIERLAGGDPATVVRYVVGASPLFVAAACMGAAIWDRNYGTLGSSAHWYLRHGVIDGDETDVAYLDACLAESYERGNSDSSRCNRVALNYIRAGLISAALTPLCLLVAL
ncbi:hypothetical protein [Salinisphaera orenii]|uniref:SMODS and SLOG-associating 2TM effector domain-containing protein n=1 Tax=Salinisphaera orenii YIM 95161 TaxID=1051139 RepID=A0A423PQQ8_9GAMM|nr:hypothetical protein [Salinisphaera halophila]ROO27902.1 hypothetical protein SAHL_11025 [Salinisphaera halophila YIM 95161]